MFTRVLSSAAQKRSSRRMGNVRSFNSLCCCPPLGSSKFIFHVGALPRNYIAEFRYILVHFSIRGYPLGLWLEGLIARLFWEWTPAL